MTDPVAAALADNLQRFPQVSLTDAIRAILISAGVRRGPAAQYVMASRSQIERWGQEADAINTPSGVGPVFTALCGVPLVEVAGPMRLVWIEEVKPPESADD